MSMLIMGDEKRQDDTTVMLAESVLKGIKDEVGTDGASADMMSSDSVKQSVTELKTAFQSGNDERIYQSLTGFMDAYMARRDSMNSRDSGGRDYGL